MRMFRLLSASLALWGSAVFAGPVPVANYTFDHTFASSIGGAPSLVAVDPGGASGFVTDLVMGTSQTVYNFVGSSQNVGQSGLSLNAAGLLSSGSVYTMEIVFKFTQNANAWRRILDVQNRQSDNGFYVGPNNTLDLYPYAGGAAFGYDTYHDVFLVVNNGLVSFYLDGSAQATVNTPIMDAELGLFDFFLDNLVGPGQGEYSSGSVARISLYDVALDASDIPSPGQTVPEPGSLALVGLAMAGLAAGRRRGRA